MRSAVSFPSIASNVSSALDPSARASTMSISAHDVAPDISTMPVNRIEASLTASVIDRPSGAVARQSWRRDWAREARSLRFSMLLVADIGCLIVIGRTVWRYYFGGF